MSWLPRIGVSETSLCYDWGEAEGRMVFLTWGPLHLEMTLAWRCRAVEPGKGSLACIVCDGATDATALISDDDGRPAIIAICDDCQWFADRFGIGGSAQGGAA